MTARKAQILLLALFLLGAGFRVFGAWQHRHNLNPDFGIVSLMAKHMAEGRDVPVFFYGQGYMGSLEPMVSALACKVAGASGFVVSLGTVLCGMLVLPILYCWGHDWGGRSAGIGAVVYCVIGPHTFYMLSFIPRGGYAVTLFFSTLILWLTGKYVLAELDGRPVARWGYFVLGLAGGLSWWSNQLITATLLTAGVVFPLFLGRRLFRLRIVPFALAGLLLGSSPFWIWNAFNHWQTFQFLKSLGGTPFLHGMEIFLFDRLPTLLEMKGVPLWVTLAGSVLMVGTAGILLVTMIRAWPRRYWRHLVYGAVILLMFLATALVFCRSHFAQLSAPRYLLLLVPAAAVAAGFASAAAARRIPPWLAWTPLVLVAAGQTRGLPAAVDFARIAQTEMPRVAELQQFLEENEVEAVYTGYDNHALNFALDERISFAGVDRDRYAPYAWFNERQDEVAVLGYNSLVPDFLQFAGGTAQVLPEAGFSREPLHFAFQPPRPSSNVLPASAVTSIRDDQSAELKDRLMDGSRETYWRHGENPPRRGHIEIALKGDPLVHGLRLVSRRSKGYPERFKVEGVPAGGSEWVTLIEPAWFNFFFWSGPRPYWAGPNHRLECRFIPRALSRIRVSRMDSPRDWYWDVAEIQLLAPGDGDVPGPDALPSLLTVLEERGVEGMYSDRWEAVAVHRESGGDITTLLDSALCEAGTHVLDPSVSFGPKTALLLKSGDAPSSITRLRERGVAMRSTVVGPWTLLDFGPGDWHERYRDDPALLWAGVGILRDGEKRWATTLVRRADRVKSEGGSTEASVALLEEALAHYPNYQPALVELAASLEALGRSDDASRAKARLNSLTQPDIPAPITFRHDIEFLGVTLDKETVQPREDLAVSYYWRTPAGLENSHYTVFVHFDNGGSTLQDDHMLLEGVEWEDMQYRPFPEIFAQQRRIAIPEDAAPGTYRVSLGLVHQPTGKRMKFDTELPAKAKAVRLPVELTIVDRVGQE